MLRDEWGWMHLLEYTERSGGKERRLHQYMKINWNVLTDDIMCDLCCFSVTHVYEENHTWDVLISQNHLSWRKSKHCIYNVPNTVIVQSSHFSQLITKERYLERLHNSNSLGQEKKNLTFFLPRLFMQRNKSCDQNPGGSLKAMTNPDINVKSERKKVSKCEVQPDFSRLQICFFFVFCHICMASVSVWRADSAKTPASDPNGLGFWKVLGGRRSTT